MVRGDEHGEPGRPGLDGEGRHKRSDAPDQLDHRAVRVLSYVSPFTERPTFALWCDDRPVIAANNYLRARSDLAPSSQRTIAYNLVPFVRFLGRNGLLDATGPTGRTFWSADARSATSQTAELFKQDLDTMRRADAVTDETAERYLEAAFLLCRWWRQEGEPAFGTVVLRRARGAKPNTVREQLVDVPAAWRLPPRKDRPSPPEKMLSQEALDAVWAFLGDECRPERPEILRSKPRADWSDERRRQYAAARASYDYQRGLYCRNLAVWGALEAAGCRLSELPLLTVDDVLTHDGNDRKLLLRFLLRDETRRLGKLKTGAHTAYIGMNVRAVDAVTAWLNQREIVVARGAERGIPPHPLPMLFTKDDGAPLTTGAIVALFRRIRARVDELYPVRDPNGQNAAGRVEAPARRRRVVRTSVYPHLLRHTLMTVMRSGGVSAEVRRIQLGHTALSSQDEYGGLYDSALVASLDALVARNAERAATPGASTPGAGPRGAMPEGR